MFQILALWVGLLAPGGGEAKLILTVSPGDAVVEVNGKKLAGFRSGKAVPLPAGPASLTVQSKGYVTEKRSLKLAAGKTERLTVKLTRVAGKGALAPVAKPAPRPTARPNTKPATSPSAKPSARPAAKPSARPAAKPAARPAGKPAPVAKRPVTSKPSGKTPVARPTGPKAKPKADTGPKVKPKADTGPRPKPKTTGGRPQPKPRVDDRPRPVHKPAGGGAGGPHGVRDDSGPPSLKPYAALSFIVGGLAVTGGVIAGIAADDSAEKFDQADVLADKRKFKDESESRALLSNVLYGVGATGMVVGALLWAMDPGDRAHGAQIMPLADGGAMVGWGGTF